jgi:hypothetical protein
VPGGDRLDGSDRSGGGDRSNGFNQPGSFQPQEGFRPQEGFEPKEGFEAPNSFEPKSGFEPQGSFEPQGGFEPKGGFEPQSGFEPQGGFEPHGFEPRSEPAPPVPSAEQGRPEPVAHAAGNQATQLAQAVEPPAAGAPSPQPPPGGWPIQPLRGEPPLTLFRGKRITELRPGTEIDRFGTPDGNLTYIAGTPFEQRSLVPDWIRRPYHVYRVARPLQALSGGAIPWFDQPGGGTAFLLPEAIDQLVQTGDLVEVDAGEPPTTR